MENSPEHKPHLTRPERITLLWAFSVSLFWALFLWGFWSRGPYALGLNAFVFFIAMAGLFAWTMRREAIALKRHWAWIVPMGMIITSILVYENPFLKMVSFLVLPCIFAIFYNYAFVAENERVHWDSFFISALIARAFSAFGFIGRAIASYAQLLTPPQKGKGTARRVLLGLALFAIIALAIVVPLLSAAEPVFAEWSRATLKWFQELFSTDIAYKIIVSAIGAVVLSACALGWARHFTYAKKEESTMPIDSIVAGIVVGGILLLYLLFLGIQVRQMWVGSLPFDFKETEHLVKSGFWQLLTLSVINICIYFVTYQKTARVVQHVLTAFTVTSLLLLASAGHRVALYVTYYGFSYEKFFAAYTVLFCAVLFVWLLSRMFIRRHSDIVKFLAFLFLWMYAAITLFPVEQFVLRSNVALAQLPNSQIRLYELTMLSPDVLSLVKRYQKEGKLVEKVEANAGQPDWTPWIVQQTLLVGDKQWYEMNLSNILYGLTREKQ